MSLEEPKSKRKTHQPQPYHTRGLLLITCIAALMLMVLSADKWLGAVGLRGGNVLSGLTFIGVVYMFPVLMSNLFGWQPSLGLFMWASIVGAVLFLVALTMGFLRIDFLSIFPYFIPGMTFVVLFFVTLTLFTVEWFNPYAISLNMARLAAILLLPFTLVFAGGVSQLNEYTQIVETKRIQNHTYILMIPGHIAGYDLYECNRIGVRCDKIWDSMDLPSEFSFARRIQLSESDGRIVLNVTILPSGDSEQTEHTFIIDHRD